MNLPFRASARWAMTGAAATAAVVMALTGCSSGPSPDPTAPSRELVSMAPPAAGPADAATWNLTMGEPGVLDPRNAVATSEATVINNLCDSLLTVDADYNLLPNIVDFEIVSPTEIVYSLQGEPTFWDGTPVTAEDIAFSLQRSADPSAMVSFIYTNVADIAVTGDRDVTITFSQPDTLFNNSMATFAGMVVKKAYVEDVGDSFGTASGGLMCTGPFSLVSWLPGDSILMERNADYWNTERLAFTDRVTFTFVTDTTALTQALNAGEIDGARNMSASSIPPLQSSEAGTLFFGPSTTMVGLYMASSEGTIGSIPFRNAMQLIVDRQALADVVFKGAAEPLYTVVTPTTWPNAVRNIYEDAYEAFESARQTDIDAARELIEESGYGGERLTLAVSAGDEADSQIAQLIQQQAAEIGVELEIQAVQPLAFSEMEYDASKREGIDMYVSGTYSAVQDPLEVLGLAYLPGAFYNNTGYDNPQVTELLTQARQNFDASAQAQQIVDAQAIYEQASTIVPLLSTDSLTFQNSRLAGSVTSSAYLVMPSMVYLGSAK